MLAAAVNKVLGFPWSPSLGSISQGVSCGLTQSIPSSEDWFVLTSGVHWVRLLSSRVSISSVQSLSSPMPLPFPASSDMPFRHSIALQLKQQPQVPLFDDFLWNTGGRSVSLPLLCYASRAWFPPGDSVVLRQPF